MPWRHLILCFLIERHGDTAIGSARAGLQHWTVDLEHMSVASSAFVYACISLRISTNSQNATLLSRLVRTEKLGCRNQGRDYLSAYPLGAIENAETEYLRVLTFLFPPFNESGHGRSAVHRLYKSFQAFGPKRLLQTCQRRMVLMPF